MSAYLKKIAVIKQVKGGFSADGGSLSGLVKAETYAGFLKVDVSLINFAPLTEGKYVLGITDGLNVVAFEGLTYEGEGDFNLSSGFAFLVCFCNNTVAPVASASCGEMACALPDLKDEMVRREGNRAPKEGVKYDDEAISEVNYYERAFQGSTAVRQTEKEKADRGAGNKDAQASCPVQSKEEVGVSRESGRKTTENGKRKAEDEFTVSDGEPVKGGLAGGDFYGRMEADIKKIFAVYPKESGLEKAMEGGRFARISYGDGKYYVFGVLSVEGKPRYICYGVPAKNPDTPPPSLKDFSSYVATENGGYWMTYQDAGTGVSVKITPL